MEEKLASLFNSIKEHPLTFLRENLSVIIIIPAVLGGIWQLIELAIIDISLIRFFSISQIIPDGLLIIIIIMTIIIFNIIINNFANYIYRFLFERNINIQTYYFVIIFVYLVFLIIIDFNKTKIDLLSFYFLTNVFYFILKVIYIEKKNHSDKNISFNFFNDFYYIVLTPIVIFILLLSIFFYRLPNTDLFNFSLIERNVNIKNKLYKNEVLYMNDKYIFIKTIVENKNKKPINNIKIISFDKLISDK